MFAEGVSSRNGILWDPISTELVGQMDHIVEVELGLNEKRMRDVQLYANGGMHLKVVGAESDWGAEIGGYARDRNSLSLIQGKMSAADAAIDKRNDAFCGKKFVHGIEIVKARSKL